MKLVPGILVALLFWTLLPAPRAAAGAPAAPDAVDHHVPIATRLCAVAAPLLTVCVSRSETEAIGEVAKLPLRV